MWHNTRRGFNLIRTRNSDRKFKRILTYFCLVAIVAFFTIIISIIINNNKKLKAEGIKIYSEDTTNIYIEKAKEDNSVDKNIEEQTKKEDKAELKLTVLGELQFGGDIANNTNGDYMLAVKNMTEYTKGSDYVLATLGTNILRSDEVDENITSKYIVSRKVINAFNALNIDGLNVATDHMLDYGEDVFSVTKGILEEENIDIAGLENTTLYVENDGIKIAVIGILNEIIGTETKYTSAGIFMYNLEKIEEKIEDVKNKVDTVIIMTHLGYENSHKVSPVMNWFYKLLIDYGADMVIGSHSLGMYEVELYKDKPIIYSLGYFISDTKYDQGKSSAILNIYFDEQSRIKTLEFIPTYIKDKKEVELYSFEDEDKALTFMQMLSKNIIDRQIIDNKLLINVK